MTTTITCPSGLSGILRGMKVKEERILTDRNLVKNGGQLDALLKACWLETLDSGPYSFEGAPDWKKVLLGDRFYVLLQIRALTYGPEYAFSLNCAQEGCRARFDWSLEIGELPVQALSKTSRASFQSDNRFETQLPDAGTRLWFRLLTGEDELKLGRIKKNVPERLLSALLNYRLVEIEGVEQKDRKRFLEELSLKDADFLMGEFDRVDCGVETSIDVECPECFSVQEVELPLDASFLLPGQKKTMRRSSRR